MIGGICERPLANLEKKLPFSTSLKDLTSAQLQNRMEGLDRDPMRVMGSIHDVIGREMWIDDALCYKEGQRPKKPFKFYVQESMSPMEIPSWANSIKARLKQHAARIFFQRRVTCYMIFMTFSASKSASFILAKYSHN